MATLATELLSSSFLVNTLNGALKGTGPNPQSSTASGALKQGIDKDKSSRLNYLNRLNEIREYWVVKVIYDLVVPDIIPDSVSDEDVIIQVTSKSDPEITREIVRLFRRLNIEEVLKTILPDLLHYGSYSLLPVVREHRGIIDLVDEYDPFQVMCISDSKNFPLMYFADSSNVFKSTGSFTVNSKNTNMEYYSISDLVQFNIGVKYSKVDLGTIHTHSLKSSIPTSLDYIVKLLPENIKIRQSVSFIDSVLDKIEELSELDPLLSAKSAASLLRPDLVGIPLPNDYDPLKSTEVVQKYQQLLNKSVNTTGSFKQLLKEVGKLQPIPIVGDRSVPQHINLREMGDVSSDSERFTDSIKTVLSSLGISPEYLFGEMRHGENLRSNVRHARRIKKIQTNLTKTLSRLAMIHLAHRFPTKVISESDFSITFKNTNNLDELEALETQDMTISTLRSAVSVIEELSKLCEDSDFIIDKNKIIVSIRDALKASGSRFSLAILSKTEVEESEEPVAPMRSGDDY